jgi:hypothetical protein
MKRPMPNRTAKFTQTYAKRLFRAAANAGVNVRLEFRLDGTIVASTRGLSASPEQQMPSDTANPRV